MTQIVKPLSAFHASIQVPGDKSLSHRALMFASLAKGTSRITGLLMAEDVRSTWACMQQMGVQIKAYPEYVEVTGQGLQGLLAPTQALDCGNSGTTMRLMMGILSGQNFKSSLIGDASLSKRPMSRVAGPLRQMGAQIELSNERFAPVTIQGQAIQGIEYELPVASAQLKSALILAGLWAQSPVSLSGAIASRDHTERLLPYFGAELTVQPDLIQIQPGQHLSARDFDVPGDPSTAAFWLAAAAIVKGSDISLPNVCLNPTRLGFVRVLQRMGASINCQIEREFPEPVGTIELHGNDLHATQVEAHEIPDLVDEVPLIAILATQATGTTSVRGAEELRIKESDRLEAIASNLRQMGGEITLYEDGFDISGPQELKGASINPFHDHRIAMAFAIAALVAKGPTAIQDPECVAISYPEFFDVLAQLSQ